MRRPGLTIVEILVVIAVIALLLGVLLPALQSAKHHGQTIKCGSNINQLILGLMMYEGENGTFPHAFDSTPTESPKGGYPGNAAFDRTGWWWFNHITEYSRKDPRRNTVLWCPARHLASPELLANVLCTNYGINPSVCRSASGLGGSAEFVGKPLATTDMPHPGGTLLMVDSGYAVISWWHATDVPPVPLGKTIEDAAYIPGLRINRNKSLWPGQELDAMEGRHPAKHVNIGFVDGHTTCVRADDLLVEKTESAYRNLRPLWVPK